jgi:hypothetical protein
VRTKQKKIEILRRWAYDESEIAETAPARNISQNDDEPVSAAQRRRTVVSVL